MDSSTSAIVATLFGYLIVAGSVLLKVPQIAIIVRHRSAEGVSLLSSLIEMVNFGISASWGISQGLKFSDFGESILILIQVLALNILIGYYSSSVGLSVVGSALVLLGVWALSIGIVPAVLHQALLSVQIVITICSRVPQMYLNYRNKSTGKLSFTTFFLAFGGAGARVMTTWVKVPWESGKVVMMGQYIVAVALNCCILLQIWGYKKQPVKKD